MTNKENDLAMWYLHNAMENLERYSELTSKETLNSSIYDAWSQIRKLWKFHYEIEKQGSEPF